MKIPFCFHVEINLSSSYVLELYQAWNDGFYKCCEVMFSHVAFLVLIIFTDHPLFWEICTAYQYIKQYHLKSCWLYIKH